MFRWLRRILILAPLLLFGALLLIGAAVSGMGFFLLWTLGN